MFRSLLTLFLMFAFFVNPLAAQELSGTLQKIKKSGIIKIGFRESQPPMSFMGKDGVPAGYSIDLGQEIAAAVEAKIGQQIKIKYIPVTAANRFKALAENKIDILCGSATKTLSRSEVVDFTQLTFVTGASFMTLRGKDIRNDFGGKKLGVVKGTTTKDSLQKMLKETGTKAQVVLLDSTAAGIKALRSQKIDAFAADQVVLIGLALAAKNPNDFSILPNLFTYEPFALAVRRNDADFRLVADRVISDLYRSKKILKIYDKWFGQFSVRRSSAFDALIQLNAIPE
jgi:ABC-type amino acid transport substrate-binding protein